MSRRFVPPPLRSAGARSCRRCPRSRVPRPSASPSRSPPTTPPSTRCCAPTSRTACVNYPGFQDNAGVSQVRRGPGQAGQARQQGGDARVLHQRLQRAGDPGILEGLSPSSLLGRARYFKYKEWPLNGQSITLYDLEHKVIRPLGEPRIHFAIICASKSCPFLRSEAFTAAKLDAQLDEQARQFVNDPFRNRFDKATRTAHLSEIFKWFDEDFRGAAGSPQKYIARYVADPEAAKLLAADGFKVEWIDYDWSLNGTPPQEMTSSVVMPVVDEAAALPATLDRLIARGRVARRRRSHRGRRRQRRRDARGARPLSDRQGHRRAARPRDADERRRRRRARRRAPVPARRHAAARGRAWPRSPQPRSAPVSSTAASIIDGPGATGGCASSRCCTTCAAASRSNFYGDQAMFVSRARLRGRRRLSRPPRRGHRAVPGAAQARAAVVPAACGS